MKIFISWSGEVSRKVALLFRDWLPSVIQAVQPYVSSEDIDKGTRWSTDIAKELEQSQFGILCVTRENLEAPWLNFEAGALSKSIDKSRVSPFLFDLKRSEIRSGPLLQFQSTIFEKEDVLKLLHSINSATEPPCLEEPRLDSIFGVWWPKLQQELTELRGTQAGPDQASEPKSLTREGNAESEILEEILELVRTQHKLLLGSVSGRPISPMAARDLRSAWAKLKEFRSSLKEGEPITPIQLEEMCRPLENPIEYIIHRMGAVEESPPFRRLQELERSK